ncbi:MULTISPECIES: YkgJ family cysteine cluster protein [Haloferax]|uniref:YkgJ family cysteine cluster protein n=1 Tax=Haloferax marinum TaxID=2666143 RepID=A0A6A8G477_9EURY|nr:MULTISPECIES: YkgJ family cysteine cluster protein [Haloferax]KAB1197010.1 YkgJ family cysteine cluster protein [Haloferax sp. CBA1150]MRW96034.1 YkgJ family cysteine cluster protein [Haloferax marinum]
MDLEAELARARELDVSELADAIESIGFECTRCGACCKGYETDDGEREPHTATLFPDEVRTIQETTSYDADGDSVAVASTSDASLEWRDIARPMPYGLVEGDDGLEGETFEWALQTNACGDCRFYEEDDAGQGTCQVHEDRPLICETYPFSVDVAGTSQPMGEAVDEAGVVRAHECEGLGRDISRGDAAELAGALKERAVREIEEAIAVSAAYEPVETEPGEVVVHDSEGAKSPDGAELQ